MTVLGEVRSKITEGNGALSLDGVSTLLSPRASALVEITNRCHLSCQHCFTSANSVDKTQEAEPADFARLFELLHLLGVRRITISGGEATLRKDWRDILSIAAQRGFELHLFTVGLNVERSDFAFLRQICSSVCVSLDWPAEHHTMLRRNRKSFGNADVFLSDLADAGIPIYIQTMITRRNFHMLQEIVDTLSARNVQMLALTHVSPQGHARHAPSDLFLVQSDLDRLNGFVRAARSRFQHVSTNLRSAEELEDQKNVFTRPYLHCLSNGSILPWFGVPERCRVGTFLRRDCPKAFSPECNEENLFRILDILQLAYSKALSGSERLAIPMDDLIYEEFCKF